MSRRRGQGKGQSVTRPGHQLHNSDWTEITGLAGGEEHHEDTVSGSLFVTGNSPWQQPAPSLMLFNSTHSHSRFWVVSHSGWVCSGPSSPQGGTSPERLVRVSSMDRRTAKLNGGRTPVQIHCFTFSLH